MTILGQKKSSRRPHTSHRATAGLTRNVATSRRCLGRGADRRTANPSAAAAP